MNMKQSYSNVLATGKSSSVISLMGADGWVVTHSPLMPETRVQLKDAELLS